jgi:hypothetical protein
VYERARSAVLAEMNRASPPLDQSDILAAQISLDTAIDKIEADAMRNRRGSPSEVLFDRSSGERLSGKGRDPWLTDLLTRASVEVENDEQQLKRLPR